MAPDPRRRPWVRATTGALVWAMRSVRDILALALLALLAAPLGAPETAIAQITLPTAPIGAPPAPVVSPTWLAFRHGPAPNIPPAAGPGVASAGPRGLIPGPGEILAVAPLRYADVSEIVGLLTADQGLKPNDGFTPQEPNFGSAGGQTYYGAGGAPFQPLRSPRRSMPLACRPIQWAATSTIRSGSTAA